MNDKNEIGFYLKKINDFLLMSANARLKELDLTFSQFHVLMYILHNTDAAVLQKDIEQHFGLKHPTVVGILKRMKKKELISIEPNPEDRRGNCIAVLPKGKRVGEEMIKGRQHMDEFITHDLTEQQKKNLKELLKIIYTKTCTGDGR